MKLLIFIKTLWQGIKDAWYCADEFDKQVSMLSANIEIPTYDVKVYESVLAEQNLDPNKVYYIIPETIGANIHFDVYEDQELTTLVNTFVIPKNELIQGTNETPNCKIKNCTWQSYARGMCPDHYIIYWEGRKKIMKEESYRAGRKPSIHVNSFGGYNEITRLRDILDQVLEKYGIDVFNEHLNAYNAGLGNVVLPKPVQIKQLQWKQTQVMAEEAKGLNCTYYIHTYPFKDIVVKSVFGAGDNEPIIITDHTGEARAWCQADFEKEVKEKYLTEGGKLEKIEDSEKCPVEDCNGTLVQDKNGFGVLICNKCGEAYTTIG